MDNPDRRTVLKFAGVAVITVAAWPVAARSMEMDGTVTFEGAAAIPEGYLRIVLENPTLDDGALSGVAETRIDSDGKATTIPFVLTPPAALDAGAPLQVVVRLERADGWLLARGSARIVAGSSVEVILSPVMY